MSAVFSLKVTVVPTKRQSVSSGSQFLALPNGIPSQDLRRLVLLASDTDSGLNRIQVNVKFSGDRFHHPRPFSCIRNTVHLGNSVTLSQQREGKITVELIEQGIKRLR